MELRKVASRGKSEREREAGGWVQRNREMGKRNSS
jgi:hypothetical protein